MNFKDYKVKFNPPHKRDYEIVYVYDKGECIDKISPDHYHIHKDILYPSTHVTQKIVDEQYKEDIEKYHREVARLNEKFKEDLFKEFEVENNPKRVKCFSLAWERGHSEGIERVYEEFDELVELIE